MKLYLREQKKITIKEAKELVNAYKTWDQRREALHTLFGIRGQKDGVPPYWLSLDILEYKLKKPLRQGYKITHLEEVAQRKINPKNNKIKPLASSKKSTQKKPFIFTKEYVESTMLPTVLDLQRNQMKAPEIAEAINQHFGHNINGDKVRGWLHGYNKGKYIPKREERCDDEISIESIEIIVALAKAGKTVDQIHSIIQKG